MKRLLLLLALFIVTYSQKDDILAYIDTIYYQSICDTPIKYKTGIVDERFNISEDEFKVAIQQAGDIWKTEARQDLFVYDPSGDLTINLVFDKRQALNDQISQDELALYNKKDEISLEIAQFENDLKDFDRRKNGLNGEISKWNNAGGAPLDVFERLNKEQHILQEEAARLNETANRLNQSTNHINADVEKLNETVSDYNQTLRNEPEEGLYDGVKNEIYIYFLTDKNELVHTLAHELGHALSLDHTEDESSIMYPFVSKTIMLSDSDREELQRVCAKQSIFAIYIRQLPKALHNLTK